MSSRMNQQIDETSKEYHLVIGIPEPLNKERVTLWLEREGDTVVLKSQREGAAPVYEMRFRPDGHVICNSINNPNTLSNFRWQ